MARDKDHERTRVTTVHEVREGIREEMERALSGTSLPVQKKQEVVTRVGAVVERYISPYPHPDVIRQIEALAPGSAALIVQTATETIRHTHEIEKREIALREAELSLIGTLAQEDLGSVREGRRYGLFAFVCILLFSGTMYYLGAKELAYIAFGVGSIGIVGQLITGGRRLKGGGAQDIEKRSASATPDTPSTQPTVHE
ncbi:MULTISPECIES: hypothetical protein [unclassified Methylobacterium]|jgi:uncharacterized membrane protein|uniref:hypothetical protein n=1 Tax=unclassified Methylobacterium TaxID=2615210 RepID=UPI001353B418|nr:hypothetical protein [Methylobacterium sp. 2A]MWV24563.1 hypothetical protein [Methylobacterium sp. 2A]